jgi:hypothetical protein
VSNAGSRADTNRLASRIPWTGEGRPDLIVAPSTRNGGWGADPVALFTDALAVILQPMTLSALLLACIAPAGGSDFVPLAEAEPAQDGYALFGHAWDDVDPPSLFAEGLGPWPVGTSLAQGYFGVYFVESAQLSGGTFPEIDPSDEALATMPSIGGGFQYKLAGSRVSFGLESMIDFAGRADALAFYSGSGGAVVAVDVDLASIGLGGGPFLSAFLGERFRAYVSGGALMQWTWYDQEGSSETDTGEGDGFGTGWYTRAGLEYLLPDYATLLGIGGRWSETTVDLSGGFGNIDLSGAQVLLTVTRSL